MKIVIYGNGEMANLAFQYFTNDSIYEIVAFTADKNYLNDETFCGLPLIPFESIELLYPPNEYKTFVAIGFSTMRHRKKMYEKIKEKGYACVNYISSHASIDPSLKIGENNFILPNVVIDPFVKIGNNNIIWASSNVCHHVTIESHTFIAAQVLIGGFSYISDNSFIGFNATIIHKIKVGLESLIGAKTLILSDTKAFTQYIGIPGIEIKSHEKNGIQI